MQFLALLEDFCVTLGKSLIPSPVHLHCRGEAASFLCLLVVPVLRARNEHWENTGRAPFSSQEWRWSWKIKSQSLSGLFVTLWVPPLCKHPKVTKSHPGDQHCSQSPAALAEMPRTTLYCPSELLPHHLLLLGRRRYDLKQNIFY